MINLNIRMYYMIKISLENGTSINIDTRDNKTRSQEAFPIVSTVLFGLILLAWAGITISDKIKEKKAKDMAKKSPEMVDKIKNSPEFKEILTKIDLMTKQAIKTYNEAVANIKSNEKIKKICKLLNINPDVSKYFYKNTEKSIKDEIVKNIADKLIKNEKPDYYYECYLFNVEKWLEDNDKDYDDNNKEFDSVDVEITKSIPIKTIDKHLSIDVNDTCTWEIIGFGVYYN